MLVLAKLFATMYIEIFNRSLDLCGYFDKGRRNVSSHILTAAKATTFSVLFLSILFLLVVFHYYSSLHAEDLIRFFIQNVFITISTRPRLYSRYKS